MTAALAQGQHFWRVRARDNTGNLSAWSVVRSFTVDTLAPSIPALLSPGDGGLVGTATPTLDWADSADASAVEDYDVQVDDDPGFGSLNWSSIPVASTATTGALADGTWYWRVRARDVLGNLSAWSVGRGFTVDTVLPIVTNVASTAANGAYGAGSVIPVTVTFSKVVNVTGTPQLTLAVGGGMPVNYTSGTGTNTLVFTYTVAAGHNSADLDYQASTSLALNGGTMIDAAENNATLTLPAPGAFGSLGANSAIVVDTAAPTVVNVSSPTANGVYGAGTSIPVTVTFSEVVTVTGIPRLTLAIVGGTIVNYSSGTGTNTLTFAYTVAAGHNSADLDYLATGSLSANGGTIRDAALNNATLTLPAPGAAGSLGASKALVIDTVAPNAPTLVSPANGSLGNSATAALDWTDSVDSSGIQGYEVQVDSDTLFSAPLEWSGLVVPSTAVTGALPEGPHAWRVRALDVAGNASAWSGARTFTTDLTAPPTPVLLTPSDAGLVTATSPALDWADSVDPSGIQNYQVYVDADAAFTAPYEWSGTPAASTTATGALASGTHYWRVSAWDLAGNLSGWSTVRSFVVDTTPPGVPTLVSPANGAAVGTSTPTLDWTDSADANGIQNYDVQVDLDSAFSAPQEWTGTVVPSTAVSGALPTLVHYWRVRARDNAGNVSGWSGSRSFTIDTTAPAVPTLLTPSDGALSNTPTPTLDWSDSSDASGIQGYEVQVDADAGFSAPLEWSGAPVPSTVVSGALAEGAHFWRVRALDRAGNSSAWTAARTFTTDLTAPPAPALLTPPDGGLLNTSTPTLDWTDSADLNGIQNYLVHVDADAAFTAPYEWSRTPAASTIVAGPLAPGTHYWRVAARDRAGNVSAWSAVRSFGVDRTPPTIPTLVSPANGALVGTSAPTLDWTDSTDANGIQVYDVQVDADPAFAAPQEWTGAVAPSTEVTGVLTDGLHYWRARALDPAGNASGWSATRSFTVNLGPTVPDLVSPLDGAFLSATTVALDWSDSTSGLGIQDYDVQVDADAAFTAPSEWSSTVVPSAAVTGTLPSGMHFWRVRSRNNAAVVSAWSVTRSFRVDTTAPIAGSVNDGVGADIDAQGSTSRIDASWSGFSDAQSGVTGYEWAIGTTPGGVDVQGFISIGLAASATNGGLGLVQGTTYFVTVRATNGAGSTSMAGSDGVTVRTGWNSAGSMAATRSYLTATLLPDGRVLVAGGNANGFNALTSCEIFDPSKGAWSATGPLISARHLHTATLLPDGRVLAVGGQDGASASSSCELYQPSTGTWGATAPLTGARLFHTATLLRDGRVLVVGGQLGGVGSSMAGCEVYDPSTGLWSPTGNLATGRSIHSAALLPNGKVLVVGGQDSSGTPLTACEVYDPALGTWSGTGPLTAGRYQHTTTLVANGKVLAVGGSPGPLAACEIYDPAIGTWSATGALSTARGEHSATLLPNGRLLVAGGKAGPALEGCELYDPASGTWAATASLSTARYVHTATLLATGRVLVAGGGGGGPLSSAELFDPDGGAWTGTGPLGAARQAHTATLLATGRVLVAGGGDPGLSTCELYNPSAGTLAATGSMGGARHLHTATLLADGDVLVTGGQFGANSLTSCEVYDAATGTWSPTGPLGVARFYHSATKLRDGRVLVAGGIGAGTTCELYDPSTGTCSATGPLAQSRLLHTATLLPDGRVLVTGGQDSGAWRASCEVYDPATGTWSTTGALAAARDRHAAVLLPGGDVLVIGGNNGASHLSSCEAFDPGTGTWSPAGALNTARQECTATLLVDGRVLAAGGKDNGSTIHSSCEEYDPATGAWSASAPMAIARYAHTSTFLPSGKVFVAGGHPGPLSTCELYDSVGAVPPGSRSVVTSVNGSTSFPVGVASGSAIVLAGSGFRGISEASGGACGRNSASDHPVVLLRGLGSRDGNGWGGADERIWVLSATGWSAGTGASVLLPPAAGVGDGQYLLFVLVNGIPSEGRALRIDSTPPTVPVLASPANAALFGAGIVTLDWNDSLDALSVVQDYDVQVDDDPLFGSVNGSTTVAASTAATAPLADGAWSWRVRSRDALGNTSGWSATRTFTVDTAAPSAPLLLDPAEGAILGTTTPTLDWGDAVDGSGIQNYDVQVDGDAAFTAPQEWSGAVIPSSAVTGALPQRLHFWRVRARDVVGNLSAWSPARSFRNDATAPTTPVLLTPADVAILGATSPTLDWSDSTDPEGIVDYEVQVDDVDTFSIPLEWSGAPAVSLATTGALPDGAHFWRVRARDGTGILSAWSSTRSFTTDTVAPPAPALLTPVDGAVLGAAAPALDWTDAADPSGILDYDAEVDDAGAFSLPLEWGSTVSPSTATTGPLGEGTHFWRVRARDRAGNAGGYSAIRQFTIDQTAPTVPANAVVSPNGGEDLQGGSVVTITWNNSSIVDANLGPLPITLGYSTDGLVWTPIATGEANDGAYPWTVASINSSAVRVRLTATDLAGNSASDMSDNVFIVGSAAAGEIVVGLGDVANDGWFETFRYAPAECVPLTFNRLPWGAYNAQNGETRPACGDVDGDGFDEVVVGLGRYTTEGGFIAILDDARFDHALIAWIRLPWSSYNSAVAATRPACGDLDGDGRAEIAVGLDAFPPAGGLVAVFEDAAAGFLFQRWLRIPHTMYNLTNGETRPALGDIDGDGRDELLVGTGTYTPSGGWIAKIDDASTAYALAGWLRLDWSAYNSADGGVWVSAGNLDADARAEIVVGTERYPTDGGRMRIFDDAVAGHVGLAWRKIDWPAYNDAVGETHPVCGDLDGDGLADIVVGFASFPSNGGNFAVLNDLLGGLALQGWGRVQWPDYNDLNGETWPAVGNIR